MARLIALLAAVGALAAAQSAPAQAPPEQISLTVVSAQTRHIWTRAPVTIAGRATLADGQPAAGRVLTVQGRPYPYNGPFTDQAKLLVGTDGSFGYTGRPVRNMQLRIVTPAGAVSQVYAVRVFHLALDGELRSLRRARMRATEVANVPEGYRISRVYLYLCRRNAERCSYLARGTATISGQQMTARATFPTPRGVRRYSVLFRYVPRAGWGDSTASERRRPKRTIAAVSD